MKRSESVRPRDRRASGPWNAAKKQEPSRAGLAAAGQRGQERALEQHWKRKFLGYSFTWHPATRRTLSPRRLMDRVRERLREGRVQWLAQTIKNLNLLLRGRMGAPVYVGGWPA